MLQKQHLEYSSDINFRCFPAGYMAQQPVYGDTPQHPQSTGTPPLQLLPPHGHPPAPAYAAPFPSPTTTFVGPPPPRMLPPGAGAPPTFIPAPAPGTPIINYVGPPPTYTAFQGYTAVVSCMWHTDYMVYVTRN